MICFVILHYIVTDETIRCVNSIMENINTDKHIIIVDNASPNSSYNKLKTYYSNEKDVTVIQTSKNLGFARGNNYGYSFAIQHFNPEFVVIMNNDMEIVQKDFFNEILMSFNKYHYYIMGPDIYSTSKNYHQNPQRRKKPTKIDLRISYLKLWLKDKLKFIIALKWSVFGKVFKRKDEKKVGREKGGNAFIDQPVVNPLLHGSCYIFSFLFIQKHPDECFFNKTFMYMEAEILYYLAIRNHEMMLYWPYAKVLHHEDIATNAEYKSQYKKSIFTIKCLLQSTKEFLKLMKDDSA